MSRPHVHDPPFRAEHIGSLLRPANLLEARVQFDGGQLDRQSLARVEDEAIKRALELQRAAGIKAFTDGEYRRHMFYEGFFDNLNGMTYEPSPDPKIFMQYVPDVKGFLTKDVKPAGTWICTDKLTRKGHSPYYHEFLYLKSLVAPDEVKNIKLTLAAPEWFHLRHSSKYAYTPEAYKSDEEYFADIAKNYREEIADLYSIGCRNIQIDDPLLAYFCAEDMISEMENLKVDHKALLDAYIGLHNACIREAPRDMHCGLHLCRGNFRGGMHFSEGGYDRIAIKLFNESLYQTFYLEYDTTRAGTFEPLKHIPTNKNIVLGLVSSKLGQLEKPEVLAAKVKKAAAIIASGTRETAEQALGRICLSPQCGFASHSEGNAIVEEDMKNKLHLVAQTAKTIWG